MKNVSKAMTAIAAMVILASTAVYSAEPTQAQIDLIENLESAVKSKNVEAMHANFHPDQQPQGTGLQQLISASMDAREFDSVEMEITDVLTSGDPSLIRVNVAVSGKHEGMPMSKSAEKLMILKEYNGQPYILQELNEISSDELDAETGSYVSKTGGFAIQFPDSWIPTETPNSIRSVIIDGVNGMAPDLGAGVMIGVVQLPMNDPDGQMAKMVAQTDAASMKNYADSFQIISEAPTTREGMRGWNIVSEFELYGENYKRSQFYYTNESLVYFIVCDMRLDIVGDDQTATIQAVADTLDSFRLISIDENVSVAQQLRSDLGRGSISGSIYTNQEFGCFVSAPEGWSLRTSSTPNTLVEMQYDNGRSIVRLITEDNVPSTVTAEQAFRGRISQLPQIVQDFKEVPAKQVVLAGETAWVSEQTYTLEALGDFSVKEATIIRDGKYYLILCQAISPDSYEKLEKDFDKIFDSFGFTY